MAYLDTSVIIAAITLEPRTADVQQWLANNANLYISSWVLTEVASALSIKLRTGAITLGERAASMAHWQRLQEQNVTLLPIDRAHFETAAIFAAQHDLGLRAGDALHLAIAAAHGLAVATLDQAMAAAAPALGIPVQPL